MIHTLTRMLALLLCLAATASSTAAATATLPVHKGQAGAGPVAAGSLEERPLQERSSVQVAVGKNIEQGKFLVLENGLLRLKFHRETGSLMEVHNQVKDLPLFPNGKGWTPAPQVKLEGGRVASGTDFSYVLQESKAQDQSVLLTWQVEGRIEVEVRVELPSHSPMAYFWPKLTNEGKRGVRSLTYPDFQALSGHGARPEDDVLVHSIARGIKILNPVQTLQIPLNPIRNASYPQAYNGMTHQLVDYFGAGVGGFFFATFDPHVTEKSVAMPVVKGKLGMAWTYDSWDDRAGADLDFDFPFVLGINTTGDWYEAADHYRQWAETTNLCLSAGKLKNRAEHQRARWLVEDIGLATFGTSATVDQSAWLRAYHDILQGPVFHVLGHDAVHKHAPGQVEKRVQVEIHPANHSALEQTGDPYAIFLADLETGHLNRRIAFSVGRDIIEIVPRATPEACPSNKLWQYLHGQRARDIVQAYGASSFYCDASAPNRSLTCLSEEHVHPPGRGRWMNAGFRELYKSTRATLTESCGSYTPVGVELMHEGLLDSFDYYQARNGGAFMGGLEGGFYRGPQLAGLAETLPVFSYLYHEYAPVALDGCGKATHKVGDIFYWMASRVALAGGIFELNNEFQPPERFPGMTRVGILHYKRNNPFDWVEVGAPGNDTYDPAKGEFLREIAAARTDYGTHFLAYGRMLPPVPLAEETIELDYVFSGNVGWGAGKPNSTTFADQRGTFSVRPIQHSAWKSEERLGLFFVNLTQEPIALNVPLELSTYAAYGLDGVQSAERVTRQGREALDWKPGAALVTHLPPREVVLIELR